MKDSEEPEMKPVAFSPYAKALSMVGITTGYIFGPLIIFGGIGYYIAQLLDSRIPLFITIALSFVISNILIFKHTPRVIERMNKRDSSK